MATIYIVVGLTEEWRGQCHSWTGAYLPLEASTIAVSSLVFVLVRSRRVQKCPFTL
jgi:hypothetical protein